MPGPEYPEYLAPSDKEVPVKDQPYDVADSPIALSPGYVADSDLEEDSKDGLVDYPANGGDGNNDDSSDNNEEEEASEEEEEDHLAPADSVIASVAPMPFPSEEEVERLLALPPPPPLPLISVSPPSAEERLARCFTAPALPSSPLPIVPHPYGSPNHVRAPPGFRAAMGRLRASSTSTHHLLHPSPPLPPPPSSLHLPPHVPTSLPLPSSPLPPLPASLFIPSPVDHMEDIPEAEESSTASPRPTRGHRIDYGFIGTLDVKTKRQRAEEGVNARVTELAAVQEQDIQDIYDVIEDTQDRRTQTHTQMQDFRIASQESLMTTFITHVSSLQGQLSAALGQIQALQARGQTHADDREASTIVGLVFSFLVSDNHNNMPPRRSSATARAAATTAARAAVAAATPMTVVGGDRSHNSDTGIRGTVRTPRECTYKDFLNCKHLSFKGTEGVVMLSQWFEKIESVFHISNCAVENQVKFATCTFLGNALTWWNSHMKTVTQDVPWVGSEMDEAHASRSLVLWVKIGESSLTGLELVKEMSDKGKLAPRYVQPFEILKRIGPVAYRLRLPKELSGVHDTFHVSNLKKCLSDASLHVSLDEIKVDKTLHFVEEPVEIIDREVKSLKRSSNFACESSLEF
ncbi:hypothetical protein Tco_0964494 [Tanacetum coccineum]